MGENGGRRVTKERVLHAEPDEVWRALTDPSLLSEWLADEAEIDLQEGGEVNFDLPDGERRGTVQRVEEERRLAFTWARPGEPETLVEFELVPLVSGTRLIVTESIPVHATAALTASAWASSLARLGGVARLALA